MTFECNINVKVCRMSRQVYTFVQLTPTVPYIPLDFLMRFLLCDFSWILVEPAWFKPLFGPWHSCALYWKYSPCFVQYFSGELFVTISTYTTMFNTHKVDNLFMMTAVTFQKNDSITGHVLWEISTVYVDTKLKGVRIACIVSDGRGWPV